MWSVMILAQLFSLVAWAVQLIVAVILIWTSAELSEQHSRHLDSNSCFLQLIVISLVLIGLEHDRPSFQGPLNCETLVHTDLYALYHIPST